MRGSCYDLAKAMRTLLKIAAGLLVLYLLLVGGVLVAMYQPPARFGRIISKMQGPVFRLVPFRPLWFVARAGRLQVGDTAPDFDLQTVDKQSRVRLSSFRGQKPVVLVFGSYT